MAKRNKEELDTETTIADMNIEGFRWYNPNKKKEQSSGAEPIKLTRKERRAIMKGAIRAVFPFIVIIILVFVLVFSIAYIWLK